MGPATLITSRPELELLIARLRNAGRFAYDSEFIGEFSFVPRLCLIQVATTDEVALIDPLEAIDLSPFWRLIADGSVEKIVHAGQQDIEPVSRLGFGAAAAIFDTQIAAGFIGLSYPLALTRLVQACCGIRLGKGLTFTHWDQRPLTAQQLRYAADDVRYLPAAREVLGQKLEAAGCMQWALQECAALCDPKLYQFDAQTAYLRVRGATSLPPTALAILRELTIWRYDAARQVDTPPRSLVKDEILLDMARNPVKAVEQLNRVRGLPRPVEQQHGAAIVAATARGLSAPRTAQLSQRSYEPTPSEKFRADAMWAAAQCLCAARGIDAALAANRQEVGALFELLDHSPAADGQALADLQIMQGWRKEVLGAPLLKLARGQLQVQLHCAAGALAAKMVDIPAEMPKN